MKIRRGKAVSVAMYGDVAEYKNRKQTVIIRATEGGIELLTLPDEQPVTLNASKIGTLITYLQRFAEEATEE